MFLITYRPHSIMPNITGDKRGFQAVAESIEEAQKFAQSKVTTGAVLTWKPSRVWDGTTHMENGKEYDNYVLDTTGHNLTSEHEGHFDHGFGTFFIQNIELV